MCVCDLHMYFALSSVSEIPHINRQLSIGHILFLLQLEKYQFHLCCSFTPPPSPTLPHPSFLLLLPLSMLLSSLWLCSPLAISAASALALLDCDDDDDDGVSRAYRGTALTYATHVCVCVCRICLCTAYLRHQLYRYRTTTIDSFGA